MTYIWIQVLTVKTILNLWIGVVNSLAKDNFQRVWHIEAHNAIFNYDIYLWN